MINGERLIGYENPADVTQYLWNGEYFINNNEKGWVW